MSDRAPFVMELRDVHVAYHGDIGILNGLNLGIRAGQVTGIIGPNGAGKSTALKTLYGFLRPSRGDIYLDGQAITSFSPFELANRGVGYVPQNRSLFNDLSVEDNLRLGCWPFRRDRARVARAIEAAYARFPILKEKRRDLAGSMSGGQQRFLEIGRTLVLDPKIILFDEPTAMIAPRIAREIYGFIRALPEQGISVVLVDQNVRQCAAVADHLYVLDLGRTRGEGDRQTFASDTQLRAMIAEWLDYQID
jgi:branched-chain amino acid transport system ATP-binding protein